MDCSPPGSSVHGTLVKNTGVGCHFLLQGILLIQESNSHLLHWQVDSWLYWVFGVSFDIQVSVVRG